MLALELLLYVVARNRLNRFSFHHSLRRKGLIEGKGHTFTTINVEHTHQPSPFESMGCYLSCFSSCTQEDMSWLATFGWVYGGGVRTLQVMRLAFMSDPGT